MLAVPTQQVLTSSCMSIARLADGALGNRLFQSDSTGRRIHWALCSLGASIAARALLSRRNRRRIGEPTAEKQDTARVSIERPSLAFQRARPSAFGAVLAAF